MFNILKLVAALTVLGGNFSFAGYERTIAITILCDNRTAMESELNESFGESVILSGVFKGGNYLFYLYTNKVTGHWTFVSLDSNNEYCILFYGDGLTTYAPQEDQRAEVY